jgi:hypothetical protein
MMQDMKTKLKIALVLVPVILMTGCRDKARSADPSPPIPGAFGWTLGQKLPESIQVNTMEGTGLGVHSYQTSANPPFETIVVGCTKDRTIYMIAGCTTNTSTLQYDVLVDALNLKYGVAEDTRPDDVPTRTWIRPAAGHEVQIKNSTADGISVNYIDLNIFKSLSDKL